MENKKQNRNRYFLQLSLIFIFLLSILLPVLIMVVSERKEISEVEKRKLTKLPVFRFEKKKLSSYPLQFEEYINDHFGLRDDLIFLRNVAIFKLFNQSPVPSVAIGKNGWLFYKTDTFGISLIDDFRGLITLTPLQLEAMRIHLETKRNWLESRGIKYLYILVPNKQSIYPEYLPDNFNQVKSNTQAGQLLNYLKKNSDFRILDLRPVLLEAKNKEPFLYYRTDSHWNRRGAYIACKSIMGRIQELFPDLKITEEADIVMNTRNESGKDLATLMGLPGIIEKDVPSVTLKSINTSQNFEPEWALKSWPNWIQPFETSNKHAMLRAVVFRDSFMDIMLPFFSEHFNKAAYIASKFDYSILEHLIKKIQPDIVIEEGIERHTFIAFLPEAVHTTIGNDLLINGKTGQAILEFRKAIKVKPEDPDCYSNLGYALLKENRFEEAIIQFENALKINPNHIRAKQNLQWSLTYMNQIDSEISSLLQKLAMEPDNPDLMNRLGQSYVKIGKNDMAIAQYKKALSLYPDHTETLNNLAVFYVIEHDFDKAVFYFEQIIRLLPEKADT